MTNLSLKDQLKALSLGNSSSDEQESPQKKITPPSKNQSNNRVNNDKKGKQKPAWLEQAQYGVELLKAYFPGCFKELKEVRPLKVGIKQDLVKYLSTCEHIVVADKACMVNSLSYYVNSVAYHKNMVEGAMRVDLEGNDAGQVTIEEAGYSAECRKKKTAKA